MATYFTTRRFDEVDASKVHVGDQIIRLIEADDFPGSGPSDRRVFDAAVEGAWTSERVDRETRYSASDLPSFTSEDGATVVVVCDQIGLTWRGSETGALQVFIHPDWPVGFQAQEAPMTGRVPGTPTADPAAAGVCQPRMLQHASPLSGGLLDLRGTAAATDRRIVPVQVHTRDGAAAAVTDRLVSGSTSRTKQEAFPR